MDDPTSTEQNRATLGRLLYVISGMLVVIPLADAFAAVLPLHLGTAEWRFGAVGLVSGALMTPLLGSFGVLAAATLLPHPRVLRTAAWLLIAAPAVLLLAAGVFLLDLIELRSQVEVGMRPAFVGAAVKALFKLLVGAGVSLGLGLASRRMVLRLQPPLPPPRRETPPLLRSDQHP